MKLRPLDRPVEISITELGGFPVLVALLAGTVGLLSLTTAKSGVLIGVVVSVTTSPATAINRAASRGFLRASPR